MLGAGFVKHVLVSFFSGAIILVLTGVFIKYGHIYYLTARVLASVVAATVSFVLDSYITFEMPIFLRHEDLSSTENEERAEK